MQMAVNVMLGTVGITHVSERCLQGMFAHISILDNEVDNFEGF